MKDPYKIINNLISTEKGAQMQPLGKYLFSANTWANKIEIKKAVEQIYDVKVTKVNTIKMRGKKRRVRYKEGKTPDWKKALVTLKEGYKIDVT